GVLDEGRLPGGERGRPAGRGRGAVPGRRERGARPAAGAGHPDRDGGAEAQPDAAAATAVPGAGAAGGRGGIEAPRSRSKGRRGGHGRRNRQPGGEMRHRGGEALAAMMRAVLPCYVTCRLTNHRFGWSVLPSSEGNPPMRHFLSVSCNTWLVLIGLFLLTSQR